MIVNPTQHTIFMI